MKVGVINQKDIIQLAVVFVWYRRYSFLFNLK